VRARGVGVHSALEDVLYGNVNFHADRVRERGVGVHRALEDVLHGNVNLTLELMQV
jgi:hypothetical protein